MKYGYPEPPWSYSPKEVNEWINAVYGGHECKKCKVEKHEKWLKNVEIDIDLNVEREIKKPSSIVLKALQKIAGYEKVEEHFELLPTSEILLRALHKAGYRKASIKINGREIKAMKIKATMEEMAKIASDKKVEQASIYALNDGEARIKISTLHSKKHHSIEIKMSKIKEKNLQKFLIYIRKRLEGKEEIK
jgi:hypothetical protein